MSILFPILYSIELFSAFTAGVIELRSQTDSPARKMPWMTLSLLLAIGVPSTLQIFFPQFELLLRRDAGRIVAGEWWRIITALFVQDGGVRGGVFNLWSLLLVGIVAERLWGGRRWLILFFVGGVLSELVAMKWKPVGAGNSVANFSLASSVVILSISRGRNPPKLIAASIAVGSGLCLLLLQDIHGAAVSIGAAIAAVLIFASPRR
jgi:membrane associated rhomboid family serine protease